MSKTYHVYILSNVARMLYVGVTSNLEFRVYQHKNKTLDGYTKKYNLFKLVYFEQFDEIRAAIQREKQIKGWLRSKKVALISSVNPAWKDLSLRCSTSEPPPAPIGESRKHCHPETIR